MVLARLLPLLAAALVAGCGPAAPDGPPAPILSAPAAAEHPVPVAIRIPGIGVDGRDVAPMGLQADGAIEVPPLDKVDQLGYYCPASPGHCGAPMPGEIGPAVLLAHINGKGEPGLFAKLADVKRGDAFEVDRSDGQTAVFRVREVQIVDKDKFPSKKVYGDTVGPEARLITCGPNELDHVAHRYRDQTIVYADLTELRPTA